MTNQRIAGQTARSRPTEASHGRLVAWLCAAIVCVGAVALWLALAYEPRRLTGGEAVRAAAAGAAPVGEETAGTDTGAATAPPPGDPPPAEPPVADAPLQRIVPRDVPEDDEPEDDAEPAGEDDVELPDADAWTDQVLRLDGAGDPGGTEPPPGMLLVPGGKVVLGVDEPWASDMGLSTAAPRHEVVVEPFFVDRTEVTNLQWHAFLEDTRRRPSDLLWRHGWGSRRPPQDAEHAPVRYVEHEEALAYAAWCGARLPTEAEWTRAARGDTEAWWPWRHEHDSWHPSFLNGAGAAPYPVAVGSFPDGASPFGALDMAGNVAEWTATTFLPYPGSGHDPAAWLAAYGFRQHDGAAVFPRVIKGGSFAVDENLFVRRPAPLRQRLWRQSGYGDALADVGLRVARSVRPGLDVLRRAAAELHAALPPGHELRAQIEGAGLDATSIGHWEAREYDERDRIITGYDHITFARRGAAHGPTMQRLRDVGPAEPFVVGVLSTSLVLDAPGLMPGTYIVTFRARGPSIGDAAYLPEHVDSVVFHRADGHVESYAIAVADEAPRAPLECTVREHSSTLPGARTQPLGLILRFTVETGHERVPRFTLVLVP